MSSIVASGQITLVDLNDAKSLTSYITSTSPRVQIYDNYAGTYTPSWASSNVVLIPNLFLTGSNSQIIGNAKSVSWDKDGTAITSGSGGYTIAASNATNPYALTIAQNILTTASPNGRYNCTIVWTDPNFNVDVTSICSFDFALVQNGTGGVSSVLSNDSAVVATANDGTGGTYSNANVTTTLTIYVGGTDDTANWTISQALSGCTVTASGTPANRTAMLTAMSADTATVTFTATRSGYPTQTAVFSVAKSKTGSAGTSPTSYWSTTGATAIQKNISGTLSPSTFTVNGYSQTGSAASAAYAGYWNVYSTTSAITSSTSWGTATRVPASGTATSGTVTVPAGSMGIKVDFLTSGGVVIDSQIVPVVSDGATGATGAPAILASVYCPSGAVVRNNSGSITAQCDLYVGSTLTTSGVTYQWYKYVSGTADQGGGANWLKLAASPNDGGGTTGWTTATLTIPASAIASQDTYKCIATYSSKGYTGLVTVQDQSDPIQLVIIADTGTVFKNGSGASKNLTCHIYQAGVELDTAGTAYTYTWSMYDSSGNASTTWTGKTGKTVSVGPSDVTNLANIVCSVSQ